MGEQSPQKAPRTASKEVRKRQLIEATIASIAANGISGTTMASVTGIARLSTGIVSLHFQSKDNLLRETLSFLAEEHRTHWLKTLEGGGLSPAEQLWAVIEAHFDPEICSTEKIAVWFAFFGDARYRRVYREKAKEFDNERVDALQRLCAAIVAEGGYADIDAIRVAKTLECLADGQWLNMMMYPDWLPPAEAQAQIETYLAAVFPQHFGAGAAALLKVRVA